MTNNTKQIDLSDTTNIWEISRLNNTVKENSKTFERDFEFITMTNMEENKGPAVPSKEENPTTDSQVEAAEENGLDMRVDSEANKATVAQGEPSPSHLNGSQPHGVPSQRSPVPAAIPPTVGRTSNFSISSILSGGGKNEVVKEGRDSQRQEDGGAKESLDREKEEQHREALSSAHAALMSEHMEKLGHAFTQVHPGSGGLHPSAALLGMRPDYLYHAAAAAAAGLRGLSSLPGGLPAHPLHPGATSPGAAQDLSTRDDKHAPGKPIPWHPWFSHHPFLPMSYANGKYKFL